MDTVSRGSDNGLSFNNEGFGFQFSIQLNLDFP